MTTTTLALHVRALAYPRGEKPLSPFAQLLVDEVGGMEPGPSGLYQLMDALSRLLRLHGAVAPDGFVVWGDADQMPEKRAASTMLAKAPHTSVHDTFFLTDYADGGEALANGFKHLMEHTGRVPDRLIVVMNEDAEYEQAFADRARWLLDVPEIITRRVDPEVGLLERDVLAVAPDSADPAALLSILEGRDADGPI